jgi:hypothetical protein
MLFVVFVKGQRDWEREWLTFTKQTRFTTMDLDERSGLANRLCSLAPTRTRLAQLARDSAHCLKGGTSDRVLSLGRHR